MLGSALNAAASKVGRMINGANKAVLVLHYTPSQRAAGGLTGQLQGFASVLSKTQDMLSADGIASATSSTSSFTLEVQYNPSSISMTANADSMPIKPLQPAFDANVPLSASVPPSIIMMIELIFEDIVIFDAFMADKLNVSMGSVANSTTLIGNAFDGRVHSVQPQTNGLLAAMQRTNTRKISLYWADMHFHGEIKDMQAKYTMFSVSGRPIRSVVNMTLVQNNAADNDVINEYWENSLEFIFPSVSKNPANQDKYSARTIAQNVGALANINF